MNKIVSSIIFLLFLISFSPNDLKASHNFVDDSGVEWKQSGSFSIFLDMSYHPLERRCVLLPVNDNETKIKQVSINSYENDRTTIGVSLKNKNLDLENRISDMGLGYSVTLVNYLCSSENVNLADYLDVFVESDIMDLSLKQQIFKILVDVELDEESQLEMLAKKERLKLITEANEIGQPVAFLPEINNCNTFAVLQRQFSVASAENEFPILATYGAGPCVIAAFYNQSNQTSSLGHLDGWTNVIPSLNMMHLSIRENDDDNIVMHLAGGDRSSVDLQLEILDWVFHNNITLESCKLNHNMNSPQSESLAIDSRTGEVYSNFSVHNITHQKNYKTLMELTASQFQKSFLKRVIPDFVEQ
jgi:hypothetical protein